jgi:pimeloyl-ACP methyl ester carboxylesterase
MGAVSLGGWSAAIFSGLRDITIKMLIHRGIARTIMICAVCVSYVRAAPAQPAPGTLVFEPYSLRTYDGQVHAIELGKLTVPESRAKAGGPSVTVAFLRLKSTSATPGSPIVFLMGGPGIPASVMAPIPPYWQLFDTLRASGDVILLDQRGLGLSSPNVDCPPLRTLFDTTFLTSQAALVRAYRNVIATCAEYWRARGVDPRAFSDVAVAEDIDDIRRALGVTRISILGFSYGTRLAMTFARLHPERVDRIVLQGPTDADLEYRESAARDSLLTRMARFAAGDSVVRSFSQNLVQRIRALFSRTDSQPIFVKIRRARGDSVVIPVGGEGLRGLVEGHLTDRRLPAFVATSERDDLTILTRWVEGMYNDFSGGAGTLMARALNCSARPSAARKAKVDSLASRSMFGPAFDNFASDPAFCASLGGQGWAPQEHVRVPIAAPVLFVTGELDDRTPPGNDAALADEFSHSTRLIVTNGGHELLPHGPVRDVVVDFFAGRDVHERVLRDELPRFLSIDEAKQPPRRRGL